MFYIFDTAKNEMICFCEDKSRLKEIINDGQKIYESNKKFSNGDLYIENGEIKEKAAPEPTATEIKQNKITEIDNKYQAIFATLSQQLDVAMLNDNTDNQTAIKKDYQDALTAYKQELGAIQ